MLKIQYLFKLSDDEIKNKSIAVIDEFLPKLINYIKSFNINNYGIIGESNINLNIDKLYDKIMGRLLKSMQNKFVLIRMIIQQIIQQIIQKKRF